MPISSGATGRVGVGVDTSIMWTPEGWKQDANPYPRSCDSYLKRYLESHPEAIKKSKTNTSMFDVDIFIMPKQKDTHDHLRNQGPDGKNMNTFEKDLNRGTNSKKQHESQDGNTTGHLSSENTSNKSSTCAIL